MACSLTIRRLFAAICAGALLLLGGCATNGDPRDPLEPLNRGIYSFNRHVDELLLKPAATIYRDAVPSPIKSGVSNFYENLRDVVSAVNNLLQGNFEDSLSDLSRVIWNTTVGIGGLFDVASHMELEKHNEDFGQTLAVWGVGNGPYLMLPLLGPSTVRDTVGMVGDFFVNPLNQIEGPGAQNAFRAGQVVDTRYQLLPSDAVLDTAALDRYNFVRDAYLQRRQSLVGGEEEPREKYEDLK